MKPSLFLALACFGSTVLAQEPFPEIGPHHRVWASVDEVLHPDGTWGWATNAVVQLEPGLHRWENGRWVGTEAGLEIAGDVVIGQTTAHRVIWAANARSPGAVDLELPDGTRLVSHVLGLAYYDAATGQSVLIAELQDSIAEVHPPDVVLYPDAFDDVQASLIYVSRRGVFEQMVVLEEAPPDPKAFGLNPDTTRLEVLTEFVDPPEAIRTARLVREETDSGRRAWMVEPDLVDEQVDFGTMFIGEGQAFIPAGEPWRMEAVAAVPVAKRWQRTPEGRTVLFEAVEYASLAPLLAQVPPSTTDPFRLEQRRQFAGAQRHLPNPKSEVINPKSPTLASARSFTAPTGVVVDYTLSSGVTNWVFKGDTTYYVTAAIPCSGTNTTFEGGTVIKFANTNNAALDLACTNVTWLGSAYRPVILTGSDDASVGAVVTTNAFSGWYAGTALNVKAPLTGVDLGHVRILRAKTAVAFGQGAYHAVRHAQLVGCETGLKLTGSIVRLRNALMSDVSTNFHLSSSIMAVEHLTVNGAERLNNTGTLYLTNSLVVGVEPAGSWSGVSNVFLSSSNGVFASVGAGSHYLASGSPYRDAGTTAINAGLQKDFKAMTTVAAGWLTGTISSPTTLGPVAARDTDIPDLGYHYAALDYLVSNVTLQAALTLTNGVALGMCGSYGFNLGSGSSVVSEGTPVAMNRWTGPPLVQEQPLALGQAKGMTLATMCYPLVLLRFTDLSLRAGAAATVFDPGGITYAEFSVRDCWWRNANFSVAPSSNQAVLVAFTNTIVERSSLSFTHYMASQNCPSSVLLFNNLFQNGSVTFTYYLGSSNAAWKVQDNLFDGTSQSVSGDGIGGYFTASHDGFTSGTANNLGGTSHKTGLTRNFQAGPLGAYYYPTTGGGLANLINAGSRNATNATLFHYTATVDLAKETNSVVDIGFHYVATDANGLPLDQDGEGWPDYLEDRNGNGLVDAGETDWQNGNDLGLSIRITTPKPGGMLP